mmetsp:Transcript_70131/g.168112  ORF Transcript_70131/g.168112 Transcript_70131/m.168112 type:complete len:91 (+) Transcript_70131:983-1255(+)
MTTDDSGTEAVEAMPLPNADLKDVLCATEAQFSTTASSCPCTRSTGGAVVVVEVDEGVLVEEDVSELDVDVAVVSVVLVEDGVVAVVVLV